MGVLFCEQEKWSHAMKQFTISIAINPQNNFVWFYLGFVCIKKNNFILAVRSFLRIIYEDPFNKNAWNNLSSIFSTPAYEICEFSSKSASTISSTIISAGTLEP